MSTESTIGVALIVKNEADHLSRLLPQLRDAKCSETGRPIFDQIVVLCQTDTTDNSANIARQYGCDVREDYVWVNDFSDKRRVSFEMLHTTWQAWIDADDEIEHAEKIRSLISEIEKGAPHVTSIWCSYFYDRHEESGNWIAVHKRERFVRADAGWRWVGTVHEHMLAPQGSALAFTNDVAILHRRDVSLDPQRNARNVAILRAARRKNPNDARSYFDLGSQMYHTMRWGRCLAYYRHFLALHTGPTERYQALHRMGDAYRMLGQPEKALRCEERAIFGDWDVTVAGTHYDHLGGRPDWKDAWYGLAEVATATGKWQMALNYNAMADPEKFGAHAVPLGMPDELLVLNPLDYNFHPLLMEHRSLGAMGKIREAYELVQTGKAIVPMHPEMIAAAAAYQGVIREKDAVDATLALAAVTPDETKATLFAALPVNLRKRKEVRDALVAPLLKGEADVTIFCGPSLEDWGPDTPRTTGIGGSETAVIEMARHLALRGLKVDVYNQCAEHEGTAGGVRYLDHQRFDPTRPTKLFVAWRNPEIGARRPPCDHAWLWIHDCNLGPNLQAQHVAPFDYVRPVSRWHGEHLLWLYPFMAGKMLPTRNGVELERFGWQWSTPEYGDPNGHRLYPSLDQVTMSKRDPHHCVWTSSPDRGLEHLLAIWSEVRSQVPDATLSVTYGFNNIDRLIQQGQVQWVAFKQRMEALAKQPGVTLTGRLTQPQLADEFRRAAVLPYTSHFLETNFISGQEAMAAGCVTLTTHAGAIPETMQDAAILLRGHPASDAYKRAFCARLVALLLGDAERLAIQERGYRRVQHLQWSGVADQWIRDMAGTSPNGHVAMSVGVAA